MSAIRREGEAAYLGGGDAGRLGRFGQLPVMEVPLPQLSPAARFMHEDPAVVPRGCPDSPIGREGQAENPGIAVVAGVVPALRHLVEGFSDQLPQLHLSILLPGEDMTTV